MKGGGGGVEGIRNLPTVDEGGGGRLRSPLPTTPLLITLKGRKTNKSLKPLQNFKINAGKVEFLICKFLKCLKSFVLMNEKHNTADFIEKVLGVYTRSQGRIQSLP